MMAHFQTIFYHHPYHYAYTLSFLFLFLLFPLVCAQNTDPNSEPVFLGPLSQLEHDVSGDVYALDTRTLQIRNLYYDGLGPAGVFWINLDQPRASARNARIIPFKDSCQIDSRLPPYSDATVTLELPPDLTLSDVRYFSMWCRAVDAEFGGIAIDPDVVKTSVPIAVGPPNCVDEAAAQMSGVFAVRDGWNCEPMSKQLQVRWRIPDDNQDNDTNHIEIELVARVNTGTYVGFGPSGANDRTLMVGSDVVIAHHNQSDNSHSVEDYYMTSQLQCSGGVGVCPDTSLRDHMNGTNSIDNIMANHTNGVTRFYYTRSLNAVDDVIDKTIRTTGESYVTWALGAFDNGEPNFHPGSTNYPQKESDGIVRVMVEWGRTPSNSCPVFVPSSDGDDNENETKKNIPGFDRPVILNTTELTARIGPAGGTRGVGAITNGVSWGIAWYMSSTNSNSTSDILIPAIAVERGKTYTFSVYGGRASGDGEEHPLYITNSSEGGYAKRTAAERRQERVYAGIREIDADDQGVYEYRATATGALCELTSPVINTDNYTWTQFAETLDRTCTKNASITNAAGKLTWTVPQDAEDIVYYQCVTHRFLGFKLVVFDAGQVNSSKVSEISNGGPLLLTSGGNETKECRVTVEDGSEERFSACELESFKPLELYYSVKETEDGTSSVVDTLFRVARDEENNRRDYVAFGWGLTSMLTSSDESKENNVMVAMLQSNGSVTLDNYLLTSKSQAGVTRTPLPSSANVSNMRGFLTDNGAFLVGRFTRPLNMTSLPALTLSGDSPFIWATGSTGFDSNSQAQPQRHGLSSSDRGIGSINLSEGSAIVQDESISRRRRRALRAHAVLMSVAWTTLTPYAVIAMRFGKSFSAPLSFNVHRILNVVSIMASIVALVLAIVYSTLDTSARHRIIGYIVVAIALAQVVSGLGRPKKNAGRIRTMWYSVHAGVGVITTVVAAVNVFLGIGLQYFEETKLGYGLAGTAYAVVVVVFIALSLMPQRFPSAVANGEEEDGGHGGNNNIEPEVEVSEI